MPQGHVEQGAFAVWYMCDHEGYIPWCPVVPVQMVATKKFVPRSDLTGRRKGPSMPGCTRTRWPKNRSVDSNATTVRAATSRNSTQLLVEPVQVQKLRSILRRLQVDLSPEDCLLDKLAEEWGQSEDESDVEGEGQEDEGQGQAGDESDARSGSCLGVQQGTRGDACRTRSRDQDWFLVCSFDAASGCEGPTYAAALRSRQTSSEAARGRAASEQQRLRCKRRAAAAAQQAGAVGCSPSADAVVRRCECGSFTHCWGHPCCPLSDDLALTCGGRPELSEQREDWKASNCVSHRNSRSKNVRELARRESRLAKKRAAGQRHCRR